MIILACHYTCNECLGPDSNMCTSCGETRIKFPSNQDVGECPCIQNLIDYHQEMCLGIK